MEPDNPIYIVVTDIQWEGSECVGAFTNLERAKAYAKKLQDERSAGWTIWSYRIEKWLDSEQLERNVAF